MPLTAPSVTGLHPDQHITDDDHVRLKALATEVGQNGGVPPDSGEHHKGNSLEESFLRLRTSLTETVHHATEQLKDVMNINTDLKRDYTNTHLYPEIEWTAELRRSNALHPEEVRFLTTRRKRIAESGALAKFLGLPEGEQVNPDDVPIIALGGSGGGYRANLGYIATFIAAKDLGFWDLLSYFAGVSGACWGIGGYLTFANRDARSLLDHFAANSEKHPVSAAAVHEVIKSPQGPYHLFGPLAQKTNTGVMIVPLDFYSTFSVAYMWLPSKGRIEVGETKPAIRKEWLQWSKVWERSGIKDGEEPFPILTAVRHERPWKDWKSKTEPFASADHNGAEHQEAEAWWQWFEFNPLEIGCDELEGWVPTWSFGRKFDKGRAERGLPEQSLQLTLGLATSAPAGPLSAYLGTIYRNLPHNIFGNALKSLSNEIVKEAPEETEKFQDHHPIHACNEANPFFGAEAEPNRGQGIENSPRVHLIDAGMSNNMPTYPFTHPNRDIDVILNCDFSSDVQKGSALERVNDFGKDKGLNFVPRVKLPPLQDLPLDDKGKPTALTAEQVEKRFEGRYAQVVDGVVVYPSHQEPLPKGFHLHNQGGDRESILYNEHHQPQARRPVTMVYLPLLPNKVQPDYDPSTAAFSSSYNLVWTSDQVHTIAKTQIANINDSVEVIRSAIREAYEKRKADRLAGKPPFIPYVDPQ